jgi:glycosyltransferase involved in cell wall biosynthesis
MIVLSIAVPCYNEEKYIAQCLASLADERFAGKLEVIVVNDGSADASPAIARQYAEAFPSIFRVIDRLNGGHGAAVNTGLSESAGKYFRVIDGDDWADTEALVSFIAALESLDADIVIDRRVDEAGGISKVRPLPFLVRHNAAMPFEAVCSPDTAPYMTMHTATARTSLVRRHDIRLMERAYYVDYEYSLKIAAFAETAAVVDVCVYHYRLGGQNQSVAPLSYVKNYDHHARVVRKALNFASRGDIGARRMQYVTRSISLIINTHLNIALIYNPEKIQGRRQAALFMSFLKAEHMVFYKLARRRYMLALALNRLGLTAWVYRRRRPAPPCRARRGSL